MKQQTIAKVTAVFALAALVAAAAVAVRLPGGEEVLGGYATSLRGRTRAQAYNARRAARALDGVRVATGATFSFNARVGPWNAAAGYRRAPVSYDGELVRAYGGGVCQTSTTLYNAALLAGLEVVERHRHIRPPAYVPPGRDAAVAMPSVDLRLRNPYPEAVRLEARTVGDSLVVAVRGRGPRRQAAVYTEIQTVESPPVVRGVDATNPGQPGFTALTYRSSGGRRGRVIAQDAYPPVSRLAP